VREYEGVVKACKGGSLVVHECCANLMAEMRELAQQRGQTRDRRVVS
jgi:hypothetical protein